MIYEEFLKTSHEDVQTIRDKTFHFLGQEMTIFLFKGSHFLYVYITPKTCMCWTRRQATFEKLQLKLAFKLKQR